MLPPSLTVETMESAKFTASVGGTGVENFAYQWQHNGDDIDGETGDTLSFNNVTVKDKGLYKCIVKNQYGDSDVSSAQLIIPGASENLG